MVFLVKTKIHRVRLAPILRSGDCHAPGRIPCAATTDCWSKDFLRPLCSLMKMPTRGKNPPVLRPAPFGKGGHWGIFRRCVERGAVHFHLLCCTDWYMNYFAPLRQIRICSRPGRN